ncbi:MULTISPECIES: PilZ domain-containing protein [Rhizobium/Agrobacterium group]|uniref:PilZ domain-containing protein n=1 Tax=Rhizobium/Agrobacterium group TaxID=227290 RepID=UPI00110DD79C|nr:MULTISPECIES: PilZ domain-containing protein [Rhizobium/Agrobacterium group]NWJ22848.1 PilZ domain-containing protein [Rhizobium sp. RM]TMV12253.1 PilZ domain-containing protein [Rhizobium sp. Td3]UXS00787.1 PilZ domain-containing protein [Agrobacterium tumefaciens]
MTNNLNMPTRGAQRSRTRIFATVRYVNQATKARVIDLSETGMALELDGAFSAQKGSRVKVESEDLGYLEGVVQWQHMNRLGLQLKLSTNTLAQLSSYFRFFHEEVKPTLAR